MRANDGDVLRDDSVFVGIGEVIDDEQWVELRRCSLERLDASDFLKTVGDAGNHLGGDPSKVSLIVEDWELMVLGDSNPVLVQQRDNYVIESRTQVVDEIAEDYTESWLRKVAGAENQRIGTAIAVSLHHDGVWVSLVVNRLKLSLQGFKVFVRPCDLCAGTT